jgi:hypothetical protein
MTGIFTQNISKLPNAQHYCKYSTDEKVKQIRVVQKQSVMDTDIKSV